MRPWRFCRQQKWRLSSLAYDPSLLYRVPVGDRQGYERQSL